MGDEKVKMVRVNTRISSTLNDWIDDQINQTGMTKSTIIMLALENYHQQKVAIENMADMGQLLQKMNDIEKRLPTTEN